jgi:hypothetical protein
VLAGSVANGGKGRSFVRKLQMMGAVVPAVVAALILAAGAGANSNNQIVLSGIGPSTVGFSGFWLWSQPGGNAYGNDGTGDVYFYEIGVQAPVEISDIVLSGNTVTEHVTSKIGSSIDCWFTGTETSKPGGPHGANGWVSFSCSAPSGASGAYPATVIISSLS